MRPTHDSFSRRTASAAPSPSRMQASSEANDASRCR
jgi:hypothetical protein